MINHSITLEIDQKKNDGDKSPDDNLILELFSFLFLLPGKIKFHKKHQGFLVHFLNHNLHLISLDVWLNFTCWVNKRSRANEYKIIAIITNPKNRKRKRLKNTFHSHIRAEESALNGRELQKEKKHSVPIIIHIIQGTSQEFFFVVRSFEEILCYTQLTAHWRNE